MLKKRFKQWLKRWKILGTFLAIGYLWIFTHEVLHGLMMLFFGYTPIFEFNSYAVSTSCLCDLAPPAVLFLIAVFPYVVASFLMYLAAVRRTRYLLYLSNILLLDTVGNIITSLFAQSDFMIITNAGFAPIPYLLTVAIFTFWAMARRQNKAFKRRKILTSRR